MILPGRTDGVHTRRIPHARHESRKDLSREPGPPLYTDEGRRAMLSREIFHNTAQLRHGVGMVELDRGEVVRVLHEEVAFFL